MRYSNEAILTNGSMSTSFTSYGFDTQQMLGFNIQATWNGILGAPVNSGAGTLKLQMSNDTVTIPGNVQVTGGDPAANVRNWTDLSGSSQSVLAGTGSSSYDWNYTIFQGRWVRLSWTQSSGSGVMSANYMAKGG